MAKNIIVCSDGTGNTAVKGRGTNVFKLFEALDLTGHRTNAKAKPQVAFYDDGVGTQAFKPLKILAGATGYGLSRNVKQLYGEIVRIYDPGDAIFLFGFSRGAFTVRTLAGFIGRCGLLDRSKLGNKQEFDAAVKRAYRAYRMCYRTRLAELLLGKPTIAGIERFREQWCLRDERKDAKDQYEIPIAFIGVWDTVDAVGLPFHLADILNTVFYRFKFPDHRLTKVVVKAHHALALDDERHSFHPLLWDESNGENRIEQVWFSGAHSNVGGGYPKQGMSLVALDWMMAAAERAGLRFIEDDRRLYSEHTNVDDKLYDPRAGLGIFYRWKVRDVAAICQEHSLIPKIHLSVLERAAHGTEGYAPGNLPGNGKVVITEPFEEDAELLNLRASKVEEVLRDQQDQLPLLTRVKGPTVLGLASYYTYLVTVTLVVIGAVAGSFSSILNPLGLLKSVGKLVISLLTSPLQTVIDLVKRIATSPELVVPLGAGILLAYLMNRAAEVRMDIVFSQFWHRVQLNLREALKQARELATPGAPKEVRAEVPPQSSKGATAG